jgi:hypothetical protein
VSVSATRRVDRGRGHTYLLDGERADGVTWITDNGIAKRALIDWAAKTTAGYAVDHWDELAEVGVAERLRTLEKSRFESLNKAARRGTDVHDMAHRLAAGEEVTVPDELRDLVDNYLRFAEEWEVRDVLAEAVVGNRKHRYMGTLDLIARLADGRLWLLDFKTSGSGIYPESALQLSAYRHAEFYLDDDSEQPLPVVDEAACVWLRSDGYDLIPVDTSPETFRIFLYAQQTARFVNAEREQFVGEALKSPRQEQVA